MWPETLNEENLNIIWRLWNPVCNTYEIWNSEENSKEILEKTFVLPYSAQFDIIICPGQGQWLRGRKFRYTV